MITILGAEGFIGGHLAAELERRGSPYRAPGRDEDLEGSSLGDVVYSVGVTDDFRRRPLDTVAAHVAYLESLLRRCDVDSLVYLSSTRAYGNADAASEDDALRLDPADLSHLYDLSKALGESLALASVERALILRLANVYGLDRGSRTFLSSLLQDALGSGKVILRTSLESTRNYVAVDDVVTSLLALLDLGATGIYNVAGPRSVSHREIADQLARLTGASIEVAPGAPTATAPDISIARLSAAVDYAPESVIDALPRLVAGYRDARA